MKKTVSFPNMPIRISISETKCKPMHYHPDVLELMFVLEGRLAVTLNHQSTFYNPGEFVVFNPGEIHSAHSEKISTLVSIYFDLKYYQVEFPYIQCIQYKSVFEDLKRSQLPYYKELRNYFIRLMLMYNKNTAFAQAIMQDLAIKMLWLLWLHFQNRKELPEQSLQRYYSISNYLLQHYREGISVTEVAENENISVTRLAHFWKDTTGMSIRQSVTRLRLSDAEKMLMDTSLTINEITYQCGFSDEKYFYQHFKAQFHVTPNEYRIKCLEDRSETVRILLAKREGERRVAAYAMKFYDSMYTPTIPGITAEELEKETNLKYLYDAILSNAFMIVRQFAATKQSIGYMQIAPGKALFLRDGAYRINWEYVYAQMHMFTDFGLSAHMMVDYDCMERRNWEALLTDLTEEIRSIWGKKVVEEQLYMIQSKVISVYEECILLAEYLQQKTPVLEARVVFML